MPSLQILNDSHAPAILTFEMENRAFFSAWVPDRGDDYFNEYQDRHRALLEEQRNGDCAFFVLFDDDGYVLGRFNLYDIQNRTASLGYRMAQKATGCGVATSTIIRLCAVAAEEYELHSLSAVAADDNPASQRVLTKSGFRILGPARPEELDGREGKRFFRELRMKR